MCITKSFILVRWNKTYKIGENSTKCWLSVNTSDKFTVFTTNLTTKNKIEQMFSSSTIKFKFWYLYSVYSEDMYLLNELEDSDDSKSTKTSSTCLLQKFGLNPIRLLFIQFSSWYERKTSVYIGPRGDPIATPSIWM